MKIISFEGIEGVGKSTQINLLKEYLEIKNNNVEVLREPGSTIAGEEIRKILLNKSHDLCDKTELLLMFAARSELINNYIVQNNYDFLLLDRFYDASIAYQGYGRGLSLDFIDSLIKFVECPVPDLSILLDIKVEEGFKRKMNDSKDRIELSGNKFFNNVRDGYLVNAKNNSNRFKIIDASKDVNDIRNSIIKIVKEL
tara:strand:- start:18804 stop:19397 length:594 start_codon:yes stop_codon:yes gene_type:complete